MSDITITDLDTSNYPNVQATAVRGSDQASVDVSGTYVIVGADADAKQQDLGVKLLKRAITSFSDFDAHANPLYLNLKILKVRDIITLNHIKLAYEFTLNSLPIDIQGLFSLSRNTVTSNMLLNSIRKNHLLIPQINHVYSGIKSLRYQVPSQWNNFMNMASSKKIILSNNPNDYLDTKKLTTFINSKEN